MNAPAPGLPQAAFASQVAAFGAIHCDAASSAYARNLSTQVTLLEAGGTTLPVTVNDAQPDNAWVCSPLTTYGAYALEEIERNLHPAFAPPLRLLCRAGAHLLERAGIDRAVALNNWLLSTNLYPPLLEVDLPALEAAALQRWPQHALWFRSLNADLNADWIAALAGCGFYLIPSRQVYLFDDLHAKTRLHGNLARDLRLLSHTRLTRVDDADLRPDDYPRIADLYAQLYIGKYSNLNPQYTALFMQRWHAAGLLRFRGFRSADGVLQAVVGMFGQGGILTAPIVGYDTSAPQSLGLYRLLMASVFDEAMATGARVNLSAGAAGFKRLRGGRPAVEYSAVQASHLPARTRRALSTLSALTVRIGIPVMQRFEL